MKTQSFKQTNSEQTKTTSPTQITTEETTTTPEKNKVFFYRDILFAVTIFSLFYSFEFIPNFSDEYYKIEKEFYAAKKENSRALKEVKKAAEDSKEYKNYLKVNTTYKSVVSKLNKVKSDEKVFGFRSFQLFATSLFPIIAIFFYVIYNLFRSYKVERKNIGIRFVHYVVIMFCFFQFFWIFKTVQDYPKYVYYLSTILSTYFVGLGVFIIHRQKNKLIQKLRNKLFRVSFYGMRYAEEDKKEKMAQIVEEPL